MVQKSEFWLIKYIVPYENDKDLFMSGFLRLSDAEICDVFVSTQGKDDFTLARAIEDALEAKNK